MIITFDFDQTLSELHVRKLAKKLHHGGNDVRIVTARNGNINNSWNQDILNAVQEIGIEDKLVTFTCMELKDKFLEEIKADIHIDDDIEELAAIKKNCSKTIGVNVLDIDKVFEKFGNYIITINYHNLYLNKK